MTATLKQSKKLLEVFEEVSSDRLQKLIESGLLIDLRDADASKIVRNEFRRVCGLDAKFKYDKTKDSWTCLPEDRGIQRITSIDQIKALDEVSFLEKGESCVNGEVMLQRAKAKGLDWSQYDAEYLLEHQDEIPKKLRKFCLPFTGTVWRDSGGGRCVACLDWCGGEWCLGWGWLGYDWDSDCRLLSLCK